MTQASPDLLTEIHPVVLPVPEADRGLKGRPKVAALSRYARQALALSARFSGIALGPLEKRDNGAPIPFNGTHWSLSHADAYVAAVTAPCPVGIDVEKIRPVSQALYKRVALAVEWDLATERTPALFVRYWTAKEAVLKAETIGFAGMSHCKVIKILDDERLELAYKDSVWPVTQHWIDNDHIVTVTISKEKVKWHLDNNTAF